MLKLWLAVVMMGSASWVFAQENNLKLLPPEKSGGKPLLQCLSERQTMRTFSGKDLPPQLLSTLLWAADGINRADGKRTAPTARNRQEIVIYVAMKSGVYLYLPKEHELKLIAAKDMRAACGLQPFHGEAPVDLIFVADLDRMGKGSPADIEFYSGTDCGFVSQNVYLFCASEGLATVVCGAIDRKKIAAELGLGENYKILLTQPVGFRK